LFTAIQEDLLSRFTQQSQKRMAIFSEAMFKAVLDNSVESYQRAWVAFPTSLRSVEAKRACYLYFFSVTDANNRYFHDTYRVDLENPSDHTKKGSDKCPTIRLSIRNYMEQEGMPFTRVPGMTELSFVNIVQWFKNFHAEYIKHTNLAQLTLYQFLTSHISQIVQAEKQNRQREMTSFTKAIEEFSAAHAKSK